MSKQVKTFTSLNGTQCTFRYTIEGSEVSPTPLMVEYASHWWNEKRFPSYTVQQAGYGCFELSGCGGGFEVLVLVTPVHTLESIREEVSRLKLTPYFWDPLPGETGPLTRHGDKAQTSLGVLQVSKCAGGWGASFLDDKRRYTGSGHSKTRKRALEVAMSVRAGLLPPRCGLVH